MRTRRADVYIEDILDAIRKIQDYVSGMDIEDFKGEERTVDAVIRNLEIIGEASKMVPDEVKERAPDIPWVEMARIRDKLIHGYFEIQHSIVWATIVDDLPPLKEGLETLLGEIR